jgi:prolyl oligopeptidase
VHKQFCNGSAATLMVILAASALNTWAQQPAAASSDATDKYLWLEDVSSSRSMDWVKAEDERSLKVLEADPNYAAYHAEALKLAEAPDRLPFPEQRGGEIYNFWRDADHTDGLFRKTSLADYLAAKPGWQTVIDYDALGKQDKAKWVSEGVNCLYPGDRHCLVSLSAGGEDANNQREFDLTG